MKITDCGSGGPRLDLGSAELPLELTINKMNKGRPFECAPCYHRYIISVGRRKREIVLDMASR